MKKRNIIIITIASVVALICVCIAIGGILTAIFSNATPETIAEVEEIVANFTVTVAPAKATPTDKPTNTPAPPNTLAPTNTPAPTSTPLPTLPPTDTPLPSSTPPPIGFSGQGDSVLDVNFPSSGFLHITGNSGSNHFAVENYSADGNQIDLLVNTTDLYDGRRPIDWFEDQHTSRLVVTATGPWQITYYPLVPGYLNTLTVPGEYQGVGDNVLLLLGGVPDVATIQGNAAERHFAVISYHTRSDLLVNTTDPYQGTVMIPPGTALLEVIATGPWTIQIRAK